MEIHTRIFSCLKTKFEQEDWWRVANFGIFRIFFIHKNLVFHFTFRNSELRGEKAALLKTCGDRISKMGLSRRELAQPQKTAVATAAAIVAVDFFSELTTCLPLLSFVVSD